MNKRILCLGIVSMFLLLGISAVSGNVNTKTVIGTKFGFVLEQVYKASPGISSMNGGIWEKHFGGPRFDCGEGIEQTADGGYIISGEYMNTDGNYDAYLIKTDENGDKQWEKIFGDGSGYSVQQTDDGGYIVISDRSGLHKRNKNGDKEWTNSAHTGRAVEQTDDGGYIITSRRALTKTDNNGDEEWHVSYCNDDDVLYAFDVHQTNDRGYIVAGQTELNRDVLLIKFNNTGTREWKKTFGTANAYEGCYRVEQTADGGYILAASITIYEEGFDRAWLIKTDSNGDEEWSKIYDGTHIAGSVDQTADGGYIVTGTCNVIVELYGSRYWESWDYNNLLLMKINANGELQWRKSYGSWGMEQGTDVKQTADGNYILTGDLEFDWNGDTHFDVYLIKEKENPDLPDLSLYCDKMVIYPPISEADGKITLYAKMVNTGECDIPPFDLGLTIDDNEKPVTRAKYGIPSGYYAIFSAEIDGYQPNKLEMELDINHEVNENNEDNNDVSILTNPPENNEAPEITFFRAVRDGKDLVIATDAVDHEDDWYYFICEWGDGKSQMYPDPGEVDIPYLTPEDALETTNIRLSNVDLMERVTVRVIDEHGAVNSRTVRTVGLAKSKQRDLFNFHQFSPLQKLLDNHPSLFSLLERFLNLPAFQ